MLIGIAGKAGAGKDTVAQWLSDNAGYETQGLADPIKEMLDVFFNSNSANWADRGWKESPHPLFGFSPRQAAQKLGTEWRDLMDPSKMMWCKWMEADWKQYGFDKNNTVVPDIRFPHEQDWVHSHGGIVIYIERTDVDEIHPHISETSLDMRKVDLTIYNRYDLPYLYSVLEQCQKEGVFADAKV